MGFYDGPTVMLLCIKCMLDENVSKIVKFIVQNTDLLNDNGKHGQILTSTRDFQIMIKFGGLRKDPNRL